MHIMQRDARIADLLAAPKARLALAWLAARPAEHPTPADSYDAAVIHPKHTRLHLLRHNPAGLLAELHTRVGRWPLPDQTVIEQLGPAEGYRRIAAALVACPAARWWWDPVDPRSQTWICDVRGITVATGLPFGTAYGHHLKATAPADPTLPRKPAITSTRLDRLPAAALLSDLGMSYERRLKASPPENLTAWDIPITDASGVFQVDGPADWIRLVERYPSHRTNFCQNPELEAAWPAGEYIWTPEWQALAADHIAIRLSVAGWLTATSQIFMVPGKGPTFCEGWGSERTYWFRPVFDQFTRLAVDHLEYGYGRPAAGSDWDLTDLPPRPSWWQRLLRRPQGDR